ncbi:MAG: hypothetical protein ABSH20_24160, partial [Tepidisphaeraceae bacterium]
SNEAVAVLKLEADGSLTSHGVLPTRAGDFPAGLALDDRGLLYVTNNDPLDKGAALFGLPASVAILDTATGREIGRYVFADSIAGTSNFPLAAAGLRSGAKLYVASQRDACVYVLDTSDPKSPKLAGRIASGSHPSGLLLSRDQSRLYIANAHSDTVSVVKTAADTIVATVLLRPEVAKDLPGATPTGLALSPDERTLYVALGDMNAVGVIDTQAASLLGYLPAGWYPTGVAVSPDGKNLLVANAKGNASRHPADDPKTDAATEGRRYSLKVIEGNVTTVATPSAKQLKELTQRVLRLNRLTPRFVNAANPLQAIGLQAGRIKHVIYIVKENRTYDQVLGDLPQGNGDKNLCLFGREVTPNLHALAERFVLMDNFYDSGEVSGDGWTWTTQGHANEYVIKNVPYQYSKRGRAFDYEGTVNEYPTGGFPAIGPDGKPLSQAEAFKNGAKAIPDVAEAPGGHIWDLVRRHGLSFRNYGCHMTDDPKPGNPAVVPGNYPASAGLQPGGHDLDGITDLDFRRFDLDYPDSDAPATVAAATGDQNALRRKTAFGQAGAPSRFSEWNREFQMMLARDPSGGTVPAFMTIRFCTDHTIGANPTRPTPRSMLADNDYAVGQLVEAISHSPIWKSTAIFVIEDDAQNGPDHVDVHRSTCHIVSPWIKAASVDHRFHNTVSVLKTMECLLGLPPMCQYDAVASSIMDWDASPSNDQPYDAIMPDGKFIVERNPEKNPAKDVSPEQREMAERSEAMDFSVADRAPADELNQIIWKTVKGPRSVMPPSPRGPIHVAAPRRDKDDDD